MSEIKSNLCCTLSKQKRVTSSGARYRGLASGKHSFGETSQQ